MANKLSGREFGKLAREELLRQLERNWGESKLVSGISLFEFSSGQKILTLYATLSGDRWWYGVSEEYWTGWNDNTHMAFLMGDGCKCECVILNPEEAWTLLRRIQPAKDKQKKVNVRIPSPGKIYVQEWKDFPFEDHIFSLGKIEAQESTLKPAVKKPAVSLAELKRLLQSMSDEERRAVLAGLKEKHT